MQNAWLPIQHLERPPISVGGLCYFYFTPVENVLQWPAINPLSGTITDDLVLKEGKSWLRCEVIEGNRTFQEEQKQEDYGPYIETSLTGFLPSDSPANTYTINQMKYRRFALVTKERTGIMRLIGNQYSGAAVTQSYSSADANGTRGRNLTFNWQSEDSAPLYLTAVTADGSVINPPWQPPVQTIGEGRMIYDPLYIFPSEGETTFTDPNLVNKQIMLVAVPPSTIMYGSQQTEYTYTPSSGTLVFHKPLHGTQNIIVLYADDGMVANGRMLYDPIYFDPAEGQTIYTNPALVGQDILLITAPPTVFNPKGANPDYIFNQTTGSITFTHPLHDPQQVIILYANKL